MISYGLLILSIIMVIISYFILVVMRIKVMKKTVYSYTGFDVAKEVTANYDVINIVKSNDIISSEYDIKRNVIRLNSKNYEGNSYLDIVISSILSGFSLVNNESSNYFRFSFLFNRIRSISFIPLIMVVLSCFISNIGDAKIALLLFLFLIIYLYMRYQIVVGAVLVVSSNLNDDIYDKVKDMLGSYVSFYKISFIVSLVMILRLMVIIMGM